MALKQERLPRDGEERSDLLDDTNIEAIAGVEQSCRCEDPFCKHWSGTLAGKDVHDVFFMVRWKPSLLGEPLLKGNCRVYPLGTLMDEDGIRQLSTFCIGREWERERLGSLRCPPASMFEQFWKAARYYLCLCSRILGGAERDRLMTDCKCGLLYCQGKYSRLEDC